MPESEIIYTYRAGRKVALTKRMDQFVVRAKPESLRELGVADAERVSAGSCRVTTRATDLEPAMSRMRHVAPTHHAYYAADTGEEFLITDRIFVTFREPLPPEQVDAFAGRYGLVKKAAYSDRDYLFQLTDHTGMNPVKLVIKLSEQEPQVASAEHDLNFRVKQQALALPTDPTYAREWHLHTHFAHTEVDTRSSAQVEAAWQLLDHFGSAEVVIGVADDGCKLDHADFDSPGKFAGWGYFQDERLVNNTDIDADATKMYQAGSNHGTSCAGVAAGEADAVLTVGAAPGCRLLPVKWESSGSRLFISGSKLKTALEYVADKVDVLSNSWGITPSSVWPTVVTNRIAELARTGGRRSRGIVFLWAAGNENCPIQHTATADVPFDDGVEQRPDGSLVWVGVSTSRVFENNLVGIPGVMHVAALASTAQRSHYSNHGTGMGVCAPTSNSHEYHRMTVAGLGITTTTGAGGGVTDGFGGTSSATPLVAGITALVISANPDLAALEVISILKQTASKDLNLAGYPRTPAASFDPVTTWDISPIAPFASGNFTDIGSADGTWSPWFGHGRVDAARAVAEAVRRRLPTPADVLRKTSAPALQIADNTSVRDTIQFPNAARVGSIKVRVDVTHTFIGDLRITLFAPSGKSVVLHSRSGGDTHDIRQTFDVSTTPALGGLAGEAVQGGWTLQIEDLAPADVGLLNNWELEIGVRATDTVIELAESPGVTIPDNQASGIERSLNTATNGVVRDITVSVDITHTFIADLIVALVSPTGTRVPLHERSGGNAHNIIRTFTSATLPILGSVRGQAIQGAWKLRLADVDARDVGKLNRWSLRIEREPVV